MRAQSIVGLVAGIAAAAAAFVVVRGRGPEGPLMVVYKSPTCGCCTAWVTHVKRAGFRVEIHDTAVVEPVKERWGVPQDLISCHTAKVGDYVIEGHVPADLIQKLLTEQPAVLGIAVPGMPSSSPGMDGPPEPYDVVTFDKDGKTELYARR